MSDIKLGLSGAESALPVIAWTPGSPPEIPCSSTRNIEAVTMLDGSRRYNVSANHPKRWTLMWDGITYSDVGTIETAIALGPLLSFINEWVSATAYPCVVSEWTYALKAGTAAGTTRYTATLVLEEVI